MIQNMGTTLEMFPAASQAQKHVMCFFLSLWEAARLLAKKLSVQNLTTELQESSLHYLASILHHKDFHNKGYKSLLKLQSLQRPTRHWVNEYSKIYRIITEQFRSDQVAFSLLDILFAFLKYRNPFLHERAVGKKSTFWSEFHWEIYANAKRKIQ